MKKIILIALILISASAVAVGKEHTGRYCAACHSVQSCSNDCHSSDDSEPSYMGVHVNPTICGRCHGEKMKNPDLHTIHGKKICSTCHSSGGWNSSIAKVPISKSNSSIAIPKSKECNYCHGFNNNERRLHGIHRPFLVEEKCPKCHGDIVYTREDILRISGREPRAIASTDSLSAGLSQEAKATIMAPVDILTGLFNSIAKTWMGILRMQA